MTGSIISWFDDAIDRFEELEKFICNYERYYGKSPTYISIPPDDYFDLMLDMNRNHKPIFPTLIVRDFGEFKYRGIPVKASDIIRHGVMTDMYHQPAYKREK